jgi:uncharacterized integral membrane protein
MYKPHMKRVLKYLKLIVIILVTVIFVAFSSANSQTIYLQLPLSNIVLEVKQFIVIFVSTLLGMLIIYLYYTAKNIKDYSANKKLKKQVEALQIEVEGLRAEAKFTNSPEVKINLLENQSN